MGFSRAGRMIRELVIKGDSALGFRFVEGRLSWVYGYYKKGYALCIAFFCLYLFSCFLYLCLFSICSVLLCMVLLLILRCSRLVFVLVWLV